MKLSSIHSQILHLLLTPLTLLSFLLCACIVYLNVSYTEKFIRQHGSAQVKHWALVVDNFGVDDPEKLTALFNAAQEEPDIRALAIIPNDEKKSLFMGPKFESEIGEQNGTYNPDEIQTKHSRDALLFHQKLDNGYDVYIEISKLPYQILDYKTILAALLLWIISSALAALLANRCSRLFRDSLLTIRNIIDEICSGKLEASIDLNLPNKELQLVAESMEYLRGCLINAQHDNQLHIDQSTQDLRETLDTIEVQNIELNIARKKALESSRIKSEFLANTSHEFRTPLNGIIGFAQLALRTDLNTLQHTYLRTILESSQNLLTSINDVLDFSKLESGKLTLEYMPTNPRTCIEETLKILAPQAQEKNLELITLIDSEMPLQLLGDPLRLRQILSNLVGNAIKFSENGNIIVRAQLVQTLDTQIEIKISVSDPGIGLSTEQQHDLFKPFTQADTSNSREHSGTGLGLSICKGLIERMDGSIGVDSQPGKGSTFWLQLKLGLNRKDPDTTGNLLLPDKRALVFSQNSMTALQLQDFLDSTQVRHESVDQIDQLLPLICDANQTSTPYDFLLIDSNPAFTNSQHQQLQKVIWQANQRYRCAIFMVASSVDHELIVDATLQKFTNICFKPLICSELSNLIGQEFGVYSEESQPQHSQPSKIKSTPITESIQKPASSTSSAETEKQSINILVVDDNTANLHLARELLKGIGVIVSEAGDGKRALQLCEQQKFDLIFMDVQMPILDGMDTTRELRLREGGGHRTPVIALTAHAMSDQKTNLLMAGMDDYLHKPVSEEQLKHAISRWCKKSPHLNTKQPENIAPPANSTAKTVAPDQNTPNMPVDRSLCLTLANNKPDLASDLLKMLIEMISKDQAQIRKLWQDKNFEELGERVHKLYGSSCYSGVPNLKDVCGKLDKALQQQQYDNLDNAMKQLNDALTEIIVWSEEFDIDALFE